MSRERIEPGDPDFGVFTKVASWHMLIESLPTWDEMIEIEYVRQKGDVNMFGDWQRYAFEKGLYKAVIWIQRCNDNKIPKPQCYDVAMRNFEKEHGPRDTWITKDMKRAFLLQARLAEKRKLERELAALENDEDEDD